MAPRSRRSWARHDRAGRSARHAASRSRPRSKSAPRTRSASGLPDETVADAADAGIFSMLVPAELGGAGLGLAAVAQVTRALAHGCVSSAWTLSFFALHNWLLAKFDPAFGHELFAARPWVLAPAPLAPTGSMTPVDGGYRVGGRWECAGRRDGGAAQPGVRDREVEADVASSVGPTSLPGRRVGRSLFPMLDRSECPAVERVPDKVSGAWLFKGTRVPVKALFEDLEHGARVDDFLDWFPGVSRA